MFPHRNFLLFLSCFSVFLRCSFFHIDIESIIFNYSGLSFFLLLPRWLPYGCYFHRLLPINTSFDFFSSVSLGLTKLVFICQFCLSFLRLLSWPMITLFAINQFLLFFHLLLFLLYPYFISSFPLFFASFSQVIVLVIFLCQLFLLI